MKTIRDKTCRKCGKGYETPQHLLINCAHTTNFKHYLITLLHNQDDTRQMILGRCPIRDQLDNIKISYYRYIILSGWKASYKWEEQKYVFLFNHEINKFTSYMYPDISDVDFDNH